MSALGDIRAVSARNNVANSFHVYSIDSKTPILTGLAIDSAVYTDGSGALQAAGPLTNGQLLIGSTGTVPVAAALTGGGGISITNSAGGITVSSNSGITDGSFAATFSGPISGSSETIKYSKIGSDVVVINFPVLTQSGISVSTAITCPSSSVPSGITPFQNLTFPIQIQDNGVLSIGELVIGSNGSIRIAHADNSSFSSNTGNTGFSAFSVTYNLQSF